MRSSARPAAKPARSGECMSFPAPCATTTAACEPRGFAHTPETGPRGVSIRISIEWKNARRGRDALPGHLRIRLRRVEGTLLPGGPEGPGDAVLLRLAVPLGRDQLHLSPPAVGEDAGRLARPDTRRVRVRPQGTSADHAHAAASGRRRVGGVLPRSSPPARRSPRTDPVPVPAVAEVRPRADRVVRRL